MKKTLLTMSIVLLAVAVQAQSAIKVHSDGQISFQSNTTASGIQISPIGHLSVEPNTSISYYPVSLSKLSSTLVMSWATKLCNPMLTIPAEYSFYVLGNGNVFAYGGYLTSSPIPNERGSYPIVGATEMVSR